MKDKAQGERPTQYVNDDEISLVDLAKVLVRRWKVMAATFLLIVFGALGYSLTLDQPYEYVSLYQVAEQAPSDDSAMSALESPVSVVAKASNLYMGPASREVRESAGVKRLPFQTNLSHLSNTLLVRLTSQASEANSEVVGQMHEVLLARIANGQRELVEQRRNSLEQQLESAQSALETVEGSNSERVSELIVSYTERISDLQQQLAGLKEGQVVQVAARSIDPKGTSRMLIMMLAIVVGSLIALMSAFMMEFFVLVKNSLKEG